MSVPIPNTLTLSSDCESLRWLQNLSMLQCVRISYKVLTRPDSHRWRLLHLDVYQFVLEPVSVYDPTDKCCKLDATYIGFHKGMRAQGIDRTKFIYYSGLQPWLSYWGVFWYAANFASNCILITHTCRANQGVLSSF